MRFFFFFQAEDGIRDVAVTGVQTCALPISAKFRAMRRLWARVMRERFRATKPASWAFRTGAGSAASQLTAQQPENNIVRVTLNTLAAVLGGAQSLHTAAYDEALALPTEQSVKLALRTPAGGRVRRRRRRGNRSPRGLVLRRVAHDRDRE